MSPRGVCPHNRPKWLRCTYWCGGTMRYTRSYGGREVWRCRRCGRTIRRLPNDAIVPSQ
jgi:tRNA(Ile2) C34 agmatinyltransferase TiaS